MKLQAPTSYLTVKCYLDYTFEHYLWPKRYILQASVFFKTDLCFPPKCCHDIRNASGVFYLRHAVNVEFSQDLHRLGKMIGYTMQFESLSLHQIM